MELPRYFCDTGPEDSSRKTNFMTYFHVKLRTRDSFNYGWTSCQLGSGLYSVNALTA